MQQKEYRQDAVSVLQRLYQRLEMGRPVELEDVDRELRMGSASEHSKAIEKRRTDMSFSDRVEIKTRKKSVEPRTEAQKAYVRAMLSHELAFGIGPAGTGKTYLAVAVAVSKFIAGEVDRIVLSRPAVEAGEKLGY